MTMEKRDIPPRIAGWALVLQDFDYRLEHRPGTKMKHVDALSRNPITLLIQNDVLIRIKAAQSSDERLQLIKTLLEKNERYRNFSLEQGILYENDDKGNKLLCIPKGMQTEIVKRVHEEGHFGPKKMEEILRREYSIPKLAQKIEMCRSNCVPCILAERKSGKQEGLLNPIIKDEYPLCTYHIDHLGPMTSTAKKYKHILTIIDAFSKFVWIYPVRSTTAAEVINKLECQKAIFGSPARIITDRGPAFTSTLFQEYCKRENIRHLVTTTGVPRANGQVERVNRIIIPALTKLSIDDPSKWFKFTNDLQRFINSSYQRSVGRTPFELLTGVKMRRADEKFLEAIDEAVCDDFDDKREEIREQARKDILKVQEENRLYYNKKRRPALPYKVGDLIAIKRTQFGQTLKIHSKFLGPYKVSKVSNNDRYEVQKVGEHEGPRRTTSSADNMKPWGNYHETDTEDEESDPDERTCREQEPVTRDDEDYDDHEDEDYDEKDAMTTTTIQMP